MRKSGGRGFWSYGDRIEGREWRGERDDGIWMMDGCAYVMRGVAGVYVKR